MKKLQFHYEMDVSFSDYVNDHSFTMKCIPESNPYQTVVITKQEITPASWISYGRDSFRNPYLYGKAAEYHNHFTVVIEGEATVERLQEHSFYIPNLTTLAYPTKLTFAGEEIRSFADKYRLQFQKESSHFKDNIYALMEDIHQCMSYVPGSTSVHTSADSAYARKQGVCQDYAHIMLAACRYLQIPCLYIAGFMVGEGASHAWVRVYDPGNGKSYDIDPTNHRWVDDEYIDVLQGKDSQDCIFNKGIYRGFARETQKVIVIVKET